MSIVETCYQLTSSTEADAQSMINWRPIYKISYDYLNTVMPKLQLTYDGRRVYKSSYEGREAFS